MVLVKFVRNWRNYFENDVAGWSDPAFVAKLVDELKVAVYANPPAVKEEATPPPGADKELTYAKFKRLNAEELVALAVEKGIDLGGATQKQYTKPILKAALFPNEQD